MISSSKAHGHLNHYSESQALVSHAIYLHDTMVGVSSFMHKISFIKTETDDGQDSSS